MKKKSILAAILACGLVFSLTGCGNKDNDDQKQNDGNGDNTQLVTVKVGATAVPHQEILETIVEDLKAEGVDLQIVPFDDYPLINPATDNGELDANYFQHTPYLDNYNVTNNGSLVPMGNIHYEPLGLFPGKVATVEELQDGATIAVPNDTSNEARALLLLEAQGLIKLKEDAGLNATPIDIVENPKNIKIEELDAAQVARSLPDVDMAVINGNYALQAGLNAATDAIAIEAADSLAGSTFANILVVKDGNQDKPELQAVLKALQSEKTKQFIEEKYQGSVVPTF